MAPTVVPLYVLRVPVRYYRQPPVYFGGWRADAPPRWGDHWGHEWEQRRSGWDRWNHSAVPAPAPLPSYQRQYAGDRYPQVEQQNALRSQNYRYQPRDVVVREHYQQQVAQRPPAPAQRGTPGGPPVKKPKPQEPKHSNPVPSPQQGSAPGPRPPPSQGTAPQEHQMPGSQAPKKSPKAQGAKRERNAEKGEQQGQESKK